MGTENKASLVVMAAGMGSRFGGLKQIAPIGPNGEVIVDFSAHDAVEAGFSKMVFIIKKAIEHDIHIHGYQRIFPQSHSIDHGQHAQQVDIGQRLHNKLGAKHKCRQHGINCQLKGAELFCLTWCG